MKRPAPRPARTRSGPPRSANRGAPTGRSTWPTTTPTGRRSTNERRLGSARSWATGSACSSMPARPRSRGSSAKPIIDIVLAVSDSADERAYVPPMEAAGYVLRIREPDWFEHRLFKGPDTNINLHVFSEGCPEIDRMLAFRDRLRTHDDERIRYEDDQARAGRSPVDLRPGLRRRQGRGRRGDHRASPRRSRRRARLVDSERATRYRPGTHMNHYLLLSMPGMIVPGR